MSPRWTILIATIGQRRTRFERLMQILQPQVFDAAGLVAVSAYWNNGERPLADIRQALVDDANSEYVSFIDDDDEVPYYFVPEVLKAISDDPDYVGWQMQCYIDGVPLKPTFHSLRYDHWFEDYNGFYRDVSHLNPIRSELALIADFRKTDPPEDVAWADQMRPYVHTENYIDRVMYHYYSSTSDSTWRPGSVNPGNHVRSDITCPYFSWHPESAS